MSDELQKLFSGTVLGYAGMGMSGMGMVVVGVEPDTSVPPNYCFQELGPVTLANGEVATRTIGCLGDHRPCRNIAEALEGQEVQVGLDDMGLLPVFYTKE